MLLSNSYQKKKFAIGQSTQPPRPPLHSGSLPRLSACTGFQLKRLHRFPVPKTYKRLKKVFNIVRQ